MSCDFGPVPLPTSPMQEYWEQRFQYSYDSTANQSRSAPVTKPEKNNIAPQLFDALEKLVQEQERDEEGEKTESEQAPRKIVLAKPPKHRREQSFGQRLLSGGMGWWSTLAGEQQGSSVQKMKQS